MGFQHELRPRFSPQAAAAPAGTTGLQLASSDHAPALLWALGEVVLRAEGLLLKEKSDGEASVHSPHRGWQRGLCRASCLGSDLGEQLRAPAPAFPLHFMRLQSKSPPGEEQNLPPPSPHPCVNTRAVISFKWLHSSCRGSPSRGCAPCNQPLILLPARVICVYSLHMQ